MPAPAARVMSAPTWLPPDYAFVRQLGRGSFGEVVLARQAVVDRLVAIKRLSGASLLDPDSVQRFRREGMALAAARHPNVVQVYDLRQSGPTWLLIMEYVAGATLRAHIQHDDLPPQARWAVLTQLAEAVATAHERGVLHRDIKPGNVIVATTGQAKLADFGLARLADPWAFRTMHPSIGGTRGYLAPEVLAGRQPTAAADTFAFAVLAHATLSGRRPSQDEALPLTDGPSGRALLAALADDPGDRPTMAELARVLAADGAPVAARAASAPRDVEQDTDAGSATDVGAAGDEAPPDRDATPHLPPVFAPPPPTGSRRRRARTVAAVAASGAVAAAALVIWPSADDPAPGLAVTSIRVDADPEVGTCPQATLTYHAQVRSNGAPGEIVARWRQPDGTTTQPMSKRLEEGQTTLTATLRYVISGDAPTTAKASFEILRPQGVSVADASVEYRC